MAAVSRLPCANRWPVRVTGLPAADSDPLRVELSIATHVALPSEISESSLRSLMAFALGEEGASSRWEISLLFTTDARIQQLHLEFMNLDSPTDIMTFPYESYEFSSGEPANYGGDIVISVETAATHAVDAEWSLSEELQFLVLHGLLHILGWDDAEPGQRTGMLARQSELLHYWCDQASDVTN